MSVLDDLKQETAQDMSRAKARLAAIEAVAYAAGQLRAGGFVAEIERAGVGMVTLRFDPDAGGHGGDGPEDLTDADALPRRLPDPEPAAVPKPKPTTGLRRPRPDPELITGPIEGEERDLALEMLAGGAMPNAVARQLGRKTKQLANLKQWNKARITAIQAAAASKDRLPGTAPPPEPPRPTVKNDAMPDAMTGAERAIDAHLDKLGDVAPWSPKKDLALVEGLCRGDHAAEIAAELGVPRNILIARYKALNTNRGDIDQQKRLLRVLKARAAGAG